MAKEAKHETESADVAPPKKSKKLLIMVAAALVLLLIIGGGATFFIMKSHAPTGEDGEVATEKANAEKKKNTKEVDPVYVALDAFVVNLGSENGGPFLQLTISVEVEDLKMGEKLKKSTPKLRNNVIMLLSGKKADELITKEGKATLANEVRDLMNEILEPGGKGAEGPVKEVLFTSFIIQ